MKTEILAVGTELLTPFFQDTNSLFLTDGLNALGLRVSFKTVVGDEEEDLLRAVRTAMVRSRLILVMGGLGPTEDDRTRETIAKALGRKLVFRKELLKGIRERFRRRGLAMPPSNLKQCRVIEGAEVLDNPQGTAPGLWIETSRHRIALLPGPPRELRPMFERHVLPRLSALGRGLTARHVLKLTGLGESGMETRIRDIYRAVPKGITVTTLAAPGDLSIHLTYQGPGPEPAAEALLEGLERKMRRRLSPWIYSSAGESLEEVVGRLLIERGKTLACAESCTGGLIGHRLTEVPGSSDYFLESAVVYSNRAKIRRLGVPASVISRHGAVSAAVAKAMAVGVRKACRADFGLATTGIAGPGGGTPRKPVGLVYIALAWDGGTSVHRRGFFGGRSQVKFQASQAALDILRKALRKNGRENI
jgi:nicotinamide-nucleotide amidase